MRSRLIIVSALVCVVGVGTGTWTLSASFRGAKADTISTIVSGSAYGLAVSVADGATTLSAGPFGEVSMDCTPNPTNQEHITAAVSLFQGLLSSTTIKDNLTFAHADYSSTVTATSTIERIVIGHSLLAPLLEVEGLHAEASSTARIGVATSDTSQSYTGNLSIAGVSLPVHIPANTHLSVPGLGTLVLNEQIKENISPINSYAIVNMVDITLGAGNGLHQAAGTRIIIGHAVSMDSSVSLLAGLHSHASALSATLSVKGVSSLQLGPTPDTEIGCTGGSDEASALDLAMPPLVLGGLAQTLSTGSLTDSSVFAGSTEKLVNLSLLNGLITIQELEESAQASYDDGRGSADCTFTLPELTVDGSSYRPGSHKNARINLPGLGYLIVDEQLPTTYSIGCAFNALDIHITTPNAEQLAVGLSLIVGHVDAGITLFRA